MPRLQRPPTLKEFVIHSLLRWRDRDTLVDREDDAPTMRLNRHRPDREPPRAEPPPASRDSFVFDLGVVPR